MTDTRPPAGPGPGPRFRQVPDAGGDACPGAAHARDAERLIRAAGRPQGPDEILARARVHAALAVFQANAEIAERLAALAARDAGSGISQEQDVPAGDLQSLIETGHFRPGDIITVRRPRNNRIWTVQVTSDGSVRLSGGRECSSSPSPSPGPGGEPEPGP